MLGRRVASLLCIALLTALSFEASAATISAINKSIGFVYQLDDGESFDFEVPGLTSDCGSNIYRVRTTSQPILNRKFALILSAFLSERTIAFAYQDVGGCEGSRKLVEWVRITP